MHELSLIQSLVSIVADSARQNSIARVNMVRLVVGEAHGALPDALGFAFQTLTSGTVCEGARLEVEGHPLVLKCKGCHREFRVKEHGWSCPECGESKSDVIGGKELYIDYYEAEEG